MAETTPITIRLRPDEIEQLANGGELLLRILPPKGFVAPPDLARRKVLAEREEAGNGARIEQIAATWNTHAESFGTDAGPGRLTPAWRLRDRKAALRIEKSIETLGVKRIEDEMAVYFDACRRGQHLTGGVGRSFAYGFVDAFCARLLTPQYAAQTLWWQRTAKAGPQKLVDANAELTVRLADAFAARFLGRASYGLANPSDDYGRFAAASARLAAFVIGAGLPVERAMASLLDCVADAHPERAYPGNLGSDHTWRVLMPQWVRRAFGKSS